MKSSMDVTRLPGSFKDPCGNVYVGLEKIYRTLSKDVLPDYRYIRDSRVVKKLICDNKLISAHEVDHKSVSGIPDDVGLVLEHPKLDMITYPYEWCFSLLKRAALFHIEMQMSLIEEDIILCDASAFNIQFIGSDPIFIDYLSLRKYKEGSYWLSQNQFFEQFINPLLFTSETGAYFNSWYRGSPDGIDSDQLLKVLPFHKKYMPYVFFYLQLPKILQNRLNKKKTIDAVSEQNRRHMPKKTLITIWRSLYNWVSGLNMKGMESTWSNYENDNYYSTNEWEARNKIVENFISSTQPRKLIDVGCNVGATAEIAVKRGVGCVIGLDNDIQSLEIATLKARKLRVPFLPVYQDFSNPTPSQGWNNAERDSMSKRLKGDAVLSLALAHHLVVGKNIPLSEVLEWIVGIAPKGLIEFVPKNDPAVKKMLSYRANMFDDYNVTVFESIISKNARILSSHVITDSGRTIFRYER